MAMIAIPLAALTAASTFAGGMVAMRFSKWIHTLIALSGGIVVAVAIFDVMPEAFRALDGHERRAATLVGAGFLIGFLMERGLVLHHRDAPDQARAHEQVGVMAALGLCLHSFIDGLAIGLAFGLDDATGFLVFLAVIGHDFADGFNTVNFILSQSQNRRRAMRWLGLDAAAPVLGAIVGSLVSVSDFQLGHVLALYTGFFLFIGATDLLPEAHEHASFGRVALTLSGFAGIYFITSFAAH